MAYLRRVHYHETDAMGIVHHANYVKWMEEARVDWLDAQGLPYRRMEELGFSSPVVEVACRYVSPTRFDDRVEIQVELQTYTGAQATFAYTMKNQTTGQVCCTATSRHCFVNTQGRVVSLKRHCPQAHSVLLAALPPKEETQ